MLRFGVLLLLFFYRTITNFQDAVMKRLDRMEKEIGDHRKFVKDLKEEMKELRDASKNSFNMLLDAKKTKLEVPKIVQREIKSIFNAYPADEQWDFDERWDGEVNKMITDQMVDDVYKSLGEKYSKDVILAGCKNHFKTKQRDFKERTNDPDRYAATKLKKKYRQRKQRVHRNRSCHVKEGEEAKLWATVGVNDMTDEEDGEGGFKVVRPENREPDVQALIDELDRRIERAHDKSNRQVLKVKRIMPDDQ